MAPARRHLVALMALLGAVALATPVLAAPTAEKPAAAELPDLPAGAETKVEDASIGGNGYYLVYVPGDWTPDRKWPLVVCYHGINGDATTWPFRQVLGGKDVIVIGMEYYKRGSEGFGAVGEDVANVKRILPPLVKKLSVDTGQLFIGGFSKGGFMTSSIAGRTLSLWAGILITGAGRGGGGGGEGGGGSGYKGKPIYIGVGENDEARKSAESAVTSYRGLGAQVTFELYKGLGHSVDANSKVMREWFMAHTKFRAVAPTIALAEQLLKRKKLGEAYAKYKEAAAASETFPPSQAAAKAALALEEQFAKSYAEAEQAAASGQVPRAGAVLRRLGREFAGCELGERALKRLPELMQAAKDEPAGAAGAAPADPPAPQGR
ncbi:MAG: hypothetical protein IMZ66_13585 [Planctomycetes bacterium]|nr:hypothetical protein [Planctomycetota bacterium]